MLRAEVGRVKEYNDKRSRKFAEEYYKLDLERRGDLEKILDLRSPSYDLSKPLNNAQTLDL